MGSMKDLLGDVPYEPDLFDYSRIGARNNDPDTSWQAALRNLKGRVTDRKRALAIHYRSPRGLTDFELGDCMGRQQTSAGKRRGELRDLGLVMATDLRRRAPSGSPAIVWTITEFGRRIYLELVKDRVH
jgi:hypothetical protein